MAYTPELSRQQSCTLRRIAWALGVPMTKAMGMVLEYITETIESKRVCQSCRDKTRCENCGFNHA